MLVLEVADSEIFAFYQPPDAGPNVGGYLGRVFPGGNFHGLSHRELLALGSGCYEVEVDERAGSERGKALSRSAEHEMLGSLRWGLFMYQVGACNEDEVLCRALLAMTPENVARAAGLLSAEWQRRLSDFAGEVPAYRERGGCRFFSSGQVTQIPDENLVAVQQWFGDRAVYESPEVKPR
jgi:hypothetical protein